MSAGALSQDDTTPIPRELALALISDMRGVPTITVGEVQLPTLRPPPGVYARGTGGGGGGNYRESDTEVSTKTSPADVAVHFAGQLREQHWTLGARAADSTTVVQMASKKDDAGRVLTGVLGVVSTADSDIRHVWIRVVREGTERD
jgi:hypothetical protein